MTNGLQTTTVGSFPKPDELRRARTQVARGRLDPQELERLEREATAFWIRSQEEAGLDVLVDGEMYRGDMVTYFSEHMEGFEISGLVRSYGNRYYRKPVAVAPVGRRNSVTVDWWRYSQGLTERPVKGMVTGPYTMADWSFNEHYPTREAFVMAMAEMVHDKFLESLPPKRYPQFYISDVYRFLYASHLSERHLPHPPWLVPEDGVVQ